MANDRIEREKQHHNRRFSDDRARRGWLKAMVGELTLDALQQTYSEAKRRCGGKDILDYGCGEGEAASYLCQYGAKSLIGIDISDVAVKKAQERFLSVSKPPMEFRVMNAEELELDDNAVDVVFGIGILHHLDLEAACKEIGALLRPDGCAIFLEPLGNNPAIWLFRTATPALRTPDEHPLVAADFRTLGRYFSEVDKAFANLTTLLTVPLFWLPGRRKVFRLLKRLDSLAFRALPPTRWCAWNVRLVLSRPVESRGAVGLPSAIVDSTKVYSQWTVFPEGFDPAASGLTLLPSPAGDFEANDILDAADIDLLVTKIRNPGLWL